MTIQKTWEQWRDEDTLQRLAKRVGTTLIPKEKPATAEGDAGELAARLKALATCPPEQVYPVDYVWFGIAADALLSQQEALKGMFAADAAMRRLAYDQQQEIERLREALKWYAGDGSTYDGIDIGQRARAALSQHTQSEDKEKKGRCP